MRCLQHYLQRKNLEYKFADTASEQQILADLKSGHDEFIEFAGLDGVAHLDDWIDALT